MYIRRLPILFGTILILARAGLTMAQTSAGSIRGSGADPTGAVLANATVTVKNLDTNSERKLITNDEGLYNADNLLPSQYEAPVETQGFPLARTKSLVRAGRARSRSPQG
jgi:hypothetical protein